MYNHHSTSQLEIYKSQKIVFAQKQPTNKKKRKKDFSDHPGIECARSCVQQERKENRIYKNISRSINHRALNLIECCTAGSQFEFASLHLFRSIYTAHKIFVSCCNWVWYMRLHLRVCLARFKVEYFLFVHWFFTLFKYNLIKVCFVCPQNPTTVFGSEQINASTSTLW